MTPTFLMKHKTDDHEYRYLGKFRLVNSDFMHNRMTGEAALEQEVRSFLYEAAINQTPLSLSLSFEDGLLTSGEFIIASIGLVGTVYEEELYDVTIVRVITITANDTITVSNPLHDALEAGLPKLTHAVREFEPLLASGDCGNTWDEETEAEINDLYATIKLIQETMEAQKRSG